MLASGTTAGVSSVRSPSAPSVRCRRSVTSALIEVGRSATSWCRMFAAGADKVRSKATIEPGRHREQRRPPFRGHRNPVSPGTARHDPHEQRPRRHPAPTPRTTPRRGGRRRPGEWVRQAVAGTIGVLVVLGLVWLGIQATNVLILVFVAILLAAGLRPAVGLDGTRLPIGLGTSILLGYGVFAVSIVAVRSWSCRPRSARSTGSRPSSRPRGPGSRVGEDSPARGTLLDGDGRRGRQSPEAVHRRRAAEPEESCAVGLTVAEAVASLVTLFTLVFFWMTEHARLQRYASRSSRSSDGPGCARPGTRSKTRLGLWVRGQLILMGSMAVATGPDTGDWPSVGAPPRDHGRFGRSDPARRPLDRGVVPGPGGRRDCR